MKMIGVGKRDNHCDRTWLGRKEASKMEQMFLLSVARLWGDLQNRAQQKLKFWPVFYQFSEAHLCFFSIFTSLKSSGLPHMKACFNRRQAVSHDKVIPAYACVCVVPCQGLSVA